MLYKVTQLKQGCTECSYGLNNSWSAEVHEHTSLVF